jgi:hypothetical protein
MKSSDAMNGRHVMHKASPEKAAELRAAAEAEETPEARAANLAHLRKLEAACEGDSFSATLRRGIDELLRDRVDVDQLASEIAVSGDRLEDFRSGDDTLPSDVIDRLVALLGGRLVVGAH